MVFNRFINNSTNLKDRRKQVSVWSFQERKIVKNINIDSHDFAFSLDNKSLAISGYGRPDMHLVNLQDKRSKSFNIYGKSYPKILKLSPDASLLSNLEGDGYETKVNIWDTEGKKIGELPSGNTEFLDFQFSPNSQLIATLEIIDDKKRVRLWTTLGQQIGEFQLSDQRIKSIKFSPDGSLLFVQGDHKAWLWPVRNLDSLLTEGCNYLKDYLVTHPVIFQELYICQNELGIKPTLETFDFILFIDMSFSYIYYILVWFFSPSISGLIGGMISLGISQLLQERARFICFPGYILCSLKQYEKAILFYDKVVEYVPRWYRVWLIRGKVLIRLLRSEEAITSYKAIPIHYSNWQAWKDVAWELSELKQYGDAIVFYNKALEVKPKNHWIWGQRGRNLHGLERYEEAIASFDEALKLKPRYDWAWRQRGWSLSHVGQYEEAIKSYDKALEINAKDHWTWRNRGWSLGQLVGHLAWI